MANRVDLLEFLLGNPKTFGLLSRKQQLELARNRPTPILDIKEYVNGVKTHFQGQWYSTYYWLTGSLSRQTLYCFICLLYGDVTVLSGGDGQCVSFYDKANDHQNSCQHIRNCELHARLINTCDPKDDISFVDREKDLTDASRRSLKKIIQLFYLSAKIRCKDIETTDMNVLQEMLSFLSFNEILVPMGTATKFCEAASESIQKNIANALSLASKNIIKNRELNKADFITAEIDVVEGKPNLFSLIVRYVHNHSVRERFLTYFETSKDYSSEEIFESAYRQLVEWEVENKLICITYDNPRIHLNSDSINICFKNDDYIKPLILYNCNYNLCWIVWQSCSKLVSVTSFFDNISAIYDFFSDRKRYMKLCEENIHIPSSMFGNDGFSLGRRKPMSCPKAFLMLFSKHFLKIKNALCHVTQNSSSWDSTSFLLAQQILQYFKNPAFVFLVLLFHKLFLRVDHLAYFVRLLSYKDIPRINKELQQTISSLYNMDNDEMFTHLWEKGLEIIGKSDHTRNHNLVDLRSTFSKIIRSTIKNIRKRFSDFRSLQLLDLINFKKFNDSKEIDTSIIEKYLDNFNILNFTKLRNELNIIYTDPSKHMEAEDLLQYFQNNGLQNVFDETTKFIHFIQCLPLTSVGNFSMTKYDRVKRFSDIQANEQDLSDYDIIIIERDLLDDLISNESFLKDVIDELLKQDVNIDFNIFFSPS